MAKHSAPKSVSKFRTPKFRAPKDSTLRDQPLQDINIQPKKPRLKKPLKNASARTKNDRSHLFAPQSWQKELVDENEINQFQDNYITYVSELNQQNAYLTDQWTVSDQEVQYFYSNLPPLLASIARKVREFRIDGQGISRGCCLAAVVALIVSLVIVPTATGNSPYVLAMDSRGGISQSVSFGSQADEKTVKRANPSVAQNVTFKYNGITESFNTTEATVRDVLKWKGVVIGYDEGVFPSLDQGVSDDELIVVGPLVKRTVAVSEDLPFETAVVDEPTIKKGIENVITRGKVGRGFNTYIVNEVDGHEITKTVLSTVVVTKPVTEIVQKGTGEVLSNGTMVSVGQPEAKAFALARVRENGWQDGEFQCLDQLWQKESGWRVDAGNMISGAYGIPQALPGVKMGVFGNDWRTSYETQILWGIDYIKKRYNTPCGAWAYWQVNRWY